MFLATVANKTGQIRSRTERNGHDKILAAAISEAGSTRRMQCVLVWLSVIAGAVTDTEVSVSSHLYADDMTP